MSIGVKVVRAAAVSAFGLSMLVVGTPSSGATGGGVRVTSDIPYATHEGIELSLDVYTPAGEGPFPAFVVIPGGKWVDIDKTKHPDVPTYLAEHGIASFAIEYRSALEFPYPAAVEDVTAAIRWVRQHAGDYQVDPVHLGAIGVSAGGHLAALIGAIGTGPTDRGARVSIVASFSGPMDLRPLVDSPDPELREAVRTFLGCSQGDPCRDIAAEASPITYVDPTDPPMVLVNSVDEIIPVDQPRGMSDALDDAGVPNTVWIGEGGHGAGYGGGDKVLDDVIPYLQAWIEGRQAPAATEERADDGGKGQEPTPTPASPSPKTASEPQIRAGRRLEQGGAFDAVVVAIAMAALILVVVEFLVIVRLRRRVAALSGGAGSPGSSEGT